MSLSQHSRTNFKANFFYLSEQFQKIKFAFGDPVVDVSEKVQKSAWFNSCWPHMGMGTKNLSNL